MKIHVELVENSLSECVFSVHVSLCSSFNLSVASTLLFSPPFSSSPQTPQFYFFLAVHSSVPVSWLQRSCDLWIINSSNDCPTDWLSSAELLWQIWDNTSLISNTKGVWKSKAANCRHCSRWQTLTHAVYVQTQLSALPVSLVRSGCMKSHQVIKKINKYMQQLGGDELMRAVSGLADGTLLWASSYGRSGFSCWNTIVA